MTNDKTVTMSRELAQNIAAYMEGSASGTVQLWRARLLEQIAAPVVERQDPVYQTCNGVDGWIDVDRIRFTARQLEPDEYECRVLFTSPTASVAVVLPIVLSAEQGPHYSDNRASELGYLAGYNACLEKVKEMNQ